MFGSGAVMVRIAKEVDSLLEVMQQLKNFNSYIILTL